LKIIAGKVCYFQRQAFIFGPYLKKDYEFRSIGKSVVVAHTFGRPGEVTRLCLSGRKKSNKMRLVESLGKPHFFFNQTTLC
jgi:hypothetical protein